MKGVSSTANKIPYHSLSVMLQAAAAAAAPPYRIVAGAPRN
jgi:hypothetical protein